MTDSLSTVKDLIFVRTNFRTVKGSQCIRTF